TMDAPWYRTSTVSPAAAGNATVAESRSATSTSNGSPVLGTKVSVAGSVDGLSTITVSDSQLKLHSAICRGGGAGVWQSAGMVRSAPASTWWPSSHSIRTAREAEVAGSESAWR